jgi:hypothetical protein
VSVDCLAAEHGSGADVTSELQGEMIDQLYGKHAAALYAQAADFNKTARFYYMKAQDAYYLANAQVPPSCRVLAGPCSTPARSSHLYACMTGRLLILLW